MKIDISKIRPQPEMVLLEAYEWPKKSEGGIFYPETTQYSTTRGGKDPWRGKVLRVGSKVKQLKGGEIVRYQPGNYFHTTIVQDRVRYILFKENLVYAIEDENEKLVKALKDKVVIEPEDLPEMHGVMYLPGNRDDKFIRGRIVIAGEGTDIEEGKRVLLENAKTWQYYNSAGKRFLIMDKVSLMASITDEAEIL